MISSRRMRGVRLVAPQGERQCFHSDSSVSPGSRHLWLRWLEGKPAIRHWHLTLTLTFATAAIALGSAPVPAAAEQITGFSTSTTTSQAGGHPDLETSFTLENPGVLEAAKIVSFNAPTGVFGNAQAVTLCGSADFALSQCPSSSQVGLITVYARFAGQEFTECQFEYGETTSYGQSLPCNPEGKIPNSTKVTAEVTNFTPDTLYHYRLRTTNERGMTVDGPDQTIIPATDKGELSDQAEPELLGTAPIFDLVPGATEALFAFIVPSLDIPIDVPVTVRTASDYGLRFDVSDISQLTPLAGANLKFWGFPADERHAEQRFPKGSPGSPAGCIGVAGTYCITSPTISDITNRPLTDNPTTCTEEPLVTSLEVQTYQNPQTTTKKGSSYPATTGCEREVFKPVLYASATTSEIDAASGLNVVLTDPQYEDLSASPSELESATVTLPPGFTINPDAADGQSACSDEQANFRSEGPAQCPDSAKIGTFEVASGTLSAPLEGSVYIGDPLPGNQYRLFMFASGFGINAKLVGSFRPNPETGQVTAYFENLPQAPFEEFQLHLFAGERALMATPLACTVYTVVADFTPWDASQPNQLSTQTFGLDSGPHGSECPGQTRPFKPTLEAGTLNARAGAFSSFTLKLNREDGDQFLGKLNFTMPPGLTANLHGVTYCREADIRAAANTAGKSEQADPSCPASSEIGTRQTLRLARGHTHFTLWEGSISLVLSRALRSAWSRLPRRWLVPMTTAP